MPGHVNFWKNVIYGGFAGFCGSLLTFPVDLSKTRLQDQVKKAGTGGQFYTSILDVIRKVSVNEGFLALYKGLPVQLIGIIPEKALKLSVNDFARYNLREADGGITRPNEMLAGAIAGTSQVVITSPMEMLKIRMQLQNRLPPDQRRPFSEVFGGILRGGLPSIYKGASATLLRDVPFTAVYFALYSNLKLACARSDIALFRRPNTDGNASADSRVSILGSFFCGLVAGSFTAVAVTPADVIKTRLQSEASKTLYNDSIVRCAQVTWQEGGFKAFFKGASGRFILIGPLFGIVLGVYEFMPRIIPL